MLFHLIDVGFRNLRVGIHNGDEDSVHVDVVLQQLRHHVPHAVVDVARLRLGLARRQLVAREGHQAELVRELFNKTLGLFSGGDFVFLHGQEDAVVACSRMIRKIA